MERIVPTARLPGMETPHSILIKSVSLGKLLKLSMPPLLINYLRNCKYLLKLSRLNYLIHINYIGQCWEVAGAQLLLGIGSNSNSCVMTPAYLS